ncbi:MAG TPA: transglutaminase domain-containing protein [Mycobacteriales bacterium]|nr:transglutaminase domain-containing protein [Mycobacteriales bacterium]
MNPPQTRRRGDHAATGAAPAGGPRSAAGGPSPSAGWPRPSAVDSLSGPPGRRADRPASAAAEPPRLALPRLLLSAALVCVAAAAAAPIFGGWATRPLLTVLGGVAVPTVVVGAGAAVRLSPAARTLAGVAVLAMHVLLAVAPGRSVVDGPRRLLTAALPADPRGPELAAVVIAAGLTGLWSASLAVRPPRPAGPRRAARTRAPSPLAPVAPAVVLLVLALAVGAGAGRPPGWVLPAVVALAGLLLVVDRLAQDTTPAKGASGPTLGGTTARAARRRWSGLLAPAAVLVVAIAVAAQLGPSAPLADMRAEPFDARSLVDQPVPPREDITPLTYFPSLRSGERELTLDVRTPEVRGGLWLRLATLPVFTGQTWTTAATYRRAGNRLPPAPDRPAGTARRVTAEVTVRGNLGWLPVPGRAVQVAAAPAELGVDTDTGDLVVSRDGPPLGPYRVTGETAVPDAARLRTDSPLPASVAEQDVTVLGTEVRSRALQVAGRVATPFGRVSAVRAYLTGPGFRLATGPGAPTGSSSFAVRTLLTTRTGTAEQYASAFSLMLRSLGYRTRVVMGFRTGRYDATLGGYRLDGSTVDVRTEVQFAGAGWVPFTVTPRTRADGSPPPDTLPPADDASSIADRESADPQTAPTVPPPPRSAPAPRPAGDPGPPLAPVVGVAAGVLLLALLTIPLAKVIRRRRRRRGDPAGRIAGAWADTVDRLVELGVPVDAGRTTGELATDAATRAPGSRIAVLARLRDASFAPSPPSAGEADAAWTAADDVRKRLRRGRSARSRARAHLDPRPLLRR